MKRTFVIALAVTVGLFVAGTAIAARNSSGTYSLPNAPVASGQTITSTWANTTLSDIKTELTDSLSRSGKGGMTAPLRTANGSSAFPAWSFTSQTGAGIYRAGADDVRFVMGADDLQTWAPTAITLGVTLDMNSHKVTNVTDPTSAQDAATMAFVGVPACLTSDFVTTSATYTNVTGLSASLLANTTYEIDFYGNWLSTATGSGEWDFIANYSGTYTIVTRGAQAVGAAGGSFVVDNTGASSGWQMVVGAATANSAYPFWTKLIFRPTSSGTFQVQARQTAGVNFTVMADTCLRVRKIR